MVYHLFIWTYIHLILLSTFLLSTHTTARRDDESSEPAFVISKVPNNEDLPILHLLFMYVPKE